MLQYNTKIIDGKKLDITFKNMNNYNISLQIIFIS
jgi:hypothetical protein